MIGKRRRRETPPPFASGEAMYKRTVDLGGVPVEISLEHADYLSSYEDFLTENPPLATAAVPAEKIAAARKFYDDGASDAYIEETEISAAAGTALLPFGRAVFHCAAFVWQQKAWLFAAPSGTGKTTQYRLWKMLFGNEVQMLNGDKAVLKIDECGVLVFPSPWRGKENMGNRITAPLGGIILLEQAAENSICRLSAKKAAGRVYLQFMFARETTEQLLAVCSLEHRLLSTAPVWLLKNRGDEESTLLCYETLEKEIFKNGV